MLKLDNDIDIDSSLIWWNPEFFVISLIIEQTNILKQYKLKPNKGIFKKNHLQNTISSWKGD